MNSVSIISLCFSGVMMLVGVTTFVITQVRAGKKDITERTQEIATLRDGIFKANMKLDQLCTTTNETRADVKSMSSVLAEHGESIAVIRRDLETAFMRIDELREQLKSVKEGK